MMAGFKTEADLCAAFVAALPKGWTAYAETGGFDILLVRGDGVQIGIEAKLKLNVDVIEQAVETTFDACRSGPDYRAVLIPDGVPGTLSRICRIVRVTVIRMSPLRSCPFYPYLPHVAPDDLDGWGDWWPMLPVKRVPLPDYVPDVVAGASSPIQLTKWKIAALKIAVLLKRKGAVSRADFKALGIDIRRWTQARWIEPGPGSWIKGENWPGFDTAHPIVFAQIEAEFEIWSAALPAALL